ncbi:MAG: hypothetical protein V3U32_02305 [Anaerolineales bacterium]
MVVWPGFLSCARLGPIATMFNMDKASPFKASARALSAFVLIALPIITVTGQIARLPYSHPELQQITFSPQLTPVNFTVTPQSTAIAPLGAQVVAPQDAGTGEVGDELDISGGDWVVGYDLVQTPDGPQWHLWLNGEVIIVEPDDPAVTSLITAFMISADNRARADADLASAGSTQNLALAGAGAGAVSLAGGSVTAAVGCAGVPFTFWAAGGTGWACAGGIVAAVGGLGALVGSVVQIFQSESDKDDAAARYDTANTSAENLFGVLKDSP